MIAYFRRPSRPSRERANIAKRAQLAKPMGFFEAANPRFQLSPLSIPICLQHHLEAPVWPAHLSDGEYMFRVMDV
jgi:hypothetical protein